MNQKAQKQILSHINISTTINKEIFYIRSENSYIYSLVQFLAVCEKGLLGQYEINEKCIEEFNILKIKTK